MLPVATITSLTATGDVDMGPGALTVLSNALPISCICDPVVGAVCVGVITETEAILCIKNGRPVATLTSMVTGVNPETGIPVETAIVETIAITEMK